MKKGLTYSDSGVNIHKADHLVNLIKKISKEITNRGFFPLNYSEIKSPVLVSSSDGVGTKLKIACMMNKHDTIGIDLVAMCVNDIIRYGAEPLFFLDYISISELITHQVEDIIKGIEKGCQEAGIILIGGETAEMPDHYRKNEYDLAGFSVGIVDKFKIIDGSAITEGDKIVGISSSGIHSNGYSLIRKICFELLNIKIDSYIPELSHTIGEELIIPTKIYTKTVKNIIKNITVHGFAHITGGGIVRNISAIVPKQYQVVIKKGSWNIHPIFNFLQKAGDIEDMEMMRTFNNGIGMAVILPENNISGIMKYLNEINEKAYIIGEIIVRKSGDLKIIFI